MDILPSLLLSQNHFQRPVIALLNEEVPSSFGQAATGGRGGNNLQSSQTLRHVQGTYESRRKQALRKSRQAAVDPLVAHLSHVCPLFGSLSSPACLPIATHMSSNFIWLVATRFPAVPLAPHISLVFHLLSAFSRMFPASPRLVSHLSPLVSYCFSACLPLVTAQLSSHLSSTCFHLSPTCLLLVPNSRACWVSISRAGAGSRGLAAFKIRNEPWNPGTLKPWNPGTLEPWNPGTLKPWNPGTETLEPSNPATVEP